MYGDALEAPAAIAARPNAPPVPARVPSSRLRPRDARLAHDLYASSDHRPPAADGNTNPPSCAWPEQRRHRFRSSASDPVFDYSQQSRGAWRIRERESGREFRSPLDDGSADDRDIAYLGRLRRPDGRPLLLIAGLRAIGSLGVAQYLVSGQHLRELYDAAAATERFSMVIGCTFDPNTLTIRSVEALTAPRLHTESS